jgi:hypothetical protein
MFSIQSLKKHKLNGNSRGRLGWRATTPVAGGGHWGTPRSTRGGPNGLGVAGPCHLFPFFFEIFLKFFFKKKISIFIYFLINFYYFIKMDMSAPRVANKMATRGTDVAFDGIC